METIKLTQYSHGAGCGCKISPAVLDKILHSAVPAVPDPRLLVGNDKRDDAAVWELGNGQCLISTTDFFMPIVDDPFDFGRIASANAISDVYAMGGKPVLAIAILGWPVDKLPPEIAARVLEGSRAICAEAGISLAGGHSIDCPEPVFGLAVNGIVDTRHLKRNSTATAGCKLYLTKALGVGILSTAQKKDLLQPEDAALALKSMVTLNSLGEKLGGIDGVTAMTDVTGFGLLGHLSEMCEGSGLSAVIDFEKIPVIPSIAGYLEKGCIPGGTTRNWASYGHKIRLLANNRPQTGNQLQTDNRLQAENQLQADNRPQIENQRLILADPQTSGGLLIAVAPEAAQTVEALLRKHNLHESQCQPFGILEAQNDHVISIR